MPLFCIVYYFKAPSLCAVDKIRQRWSDIPMNVIFVGRKSGRVKQLDLRQPLVVVAALALVFGIVGALFRSA